MKMVPLILLLMGVSGVYCDTHTLRYYDTVLSSPGSGLPEYSFVAYVDDREIVNYNSDTRRCLPKTEWMKKLEAEYWDGETQLGQRLEPVSKHNVQILMKRFNQTGEPDNGLSMTAIIAIVFAVVVLIGALGVGIFLYRKKIHGYKTASTSDNNSDSSNNPTA